MIWLAWALIPVAFLAFAYGAMVNGSAALAGWSLAGAILFVLFTSVKHKSDDKEKR